MKASQLRQLIREEIQEVLGEETSTPSDKIHQTDWNQLDWDFSNSDSINFGDFEVDINQFKQGIKNGYVIDDNGYKRSIDKDTFSNILSSYIENWPEED